MQTAAVGAPERTACTCPLVRSQVGGEIIGFTHFVKIVYRVTRDRLASTKLCNQHYCCCRSRSSRMC